MTSENRTRKAARMPALWGALNQAMVASVALATACGGEEGTVPATDDTQEASDSDGGIQLNPTAGDTVGLDANGNCNGLDVHPGCAGEVYEGEAVPLDLYLMFDQSGSMSTVVDDATGKTRMDVVRAAVRAFLADTESVGLGAGIGYFGHQPLGETTCSPSDYATPAVAIGELPGLEPALIASLDARPPTGETPTGAAIRGACSYVSGYSASNPGRNPAILLVTDGEPKAPLSEATCNPTLEDAVAAAEECYAGSGIRTYVLGVGPSLTNLRVIAEAGGTEDAFLAELDNTEQVLAALRAVRFAAQLPCEIALSEAAIAQYDPDGNDSTVAFLDLECGYHAVPEVQGASACAGTEGWYFDDPAAPTRIELCETTCGAVKSSGRQLNYAIGCPLVVVR